MLFFIMALTFISIGVLCGFLLPVAADKTMAFNQKRSQALADKMDMMFIKARVSRLVMLYTFGPVILGAIAYALFPNDLRLIGVVAAAAAGFLVPSLIVKIMAQKRRHKFDEEIVGALMLLSSSLKGGLSMIQAMEVVTEEMPDPIKQEFSMMLGENKMGASLEEAFGHLYQRMPSSELQQMITSILLARETGGNLPVIFNRLVGTIRENRKIKQNLENLTLQGRIQGVIMTLLPIGFGLFVTTTNKQFFNVMFETEVGKALLVLCVVLWCVGTFMIWKISTFRDF